MILIFDEKRPLGKTHQRSNKIYYTIYNIPKINTLHIPDK